jgi:exodeoxyribonuclease VIII
MKILHKRKETTAKSLNQTLKQLPVGELWVYGTGKLSMDEYHLIPQLSAHMIKDLANKSISDYCLYRKYVKHDVVFNKTPTMMLGTAFHTRVLEPKLYGNEYAVSPKFDKRTKDGKAQFAEWSSLNAGKMLLTEDQDQLVKNMGDAIKGNKYAKGLLGGTLSEVSAFKRLDCGVILKGRIDSVNYDGSYGVDLKSVDDCSPDGFAKACAKYRYDIQAHTYSELFGLDEFIFLCCSKADPIEVGIYQLNDEFMDKAKADFEYAISRWVQLMEKTDDWETFSNKSNPMITLAPPNWFNYL